MGSSSASWPTSCDLALYRSFMFPHLPWSVGAGKRKRGWDRCVTLPVQTLFHPPLSPAKAQCPQVSEERGEFLRSLSKNGCA